MTQPPPLDSLHLAGRNVFLRLDLNVPMQGDAIVSDARIQASLPTLRHCLDQGAKVAVASHLGRPKGQDPAFSMEPVARRLGELLHMEVLLASDCIGDGVRGLMHTVRSGSLVVLENLRFHQQEEDCDAAFAKALAQPFDCYINDAFGVSHRRHASIVGMVRHCRERAMGLLMAKEVAAVGKLLGDVNKPFVACVGGAKVADKIGVLEALLGRADVLLLGGAMAYTFLVAKGHKVGNSRVELDRLHGAKELLRRAAHLGTEVLLPSDHMAAHHFDAESDAKRVLQTDLTEGLMGLDIGPETQRRFSEKIAQARTVLWNGPMGVCEWPAFATGTHAVARSLASCNGYTVVGGGDSIAALEAAQLSEHISHISTGGGACLELLKFGTLPGLLALQGDRTSEAPHRH